MGIIFKQSLKNTFIIYLGFLIGGINTLILYDRFLTSEYYGLAQYIFAASNIITPLMPYFPLVVVFCQKYVKDTGIGTLVSLMIPYSVAFIILWTIFLVISWMLGIPLGLQAEYIYAPNCLHRPEFMLQN